MQLDRKGKSHRPLRVAIVEIENIRGAHEFIRTQSEQVVLFVPVVDIVVNNLVSIRLSLGAIPVHEVEYVVQRYHFDPSG